MIRHLKLDDLTTEEEYDPELAVIVGKKGVIVTNNEFIHWIEKEELIQVEVFERNSFGSRLLDLNLSDVIQRQGEEVNLQEWGHYWGIKDRMARNYRTLLSSMREVGLKTDNMPDFYGEKS